jgi:Outer membrane protein beta-barrel domain
MKTTVPKVHVLVLAFLIVLSSTKSFSQSITTGDGKFEIGLGLGPSFFLGDLGGTEGIGKGFIKDLDLPLTKFSKGAYFNYNPTEWFAFRIALNHSVLEGDDSQAPNKGGAEVDRLKRNLSFKSNITEAYAAIELYPTVPLERFDGLQGKLRPYVIGGIGGFHFNPKAKDVDGKWVALQPLRLEGQGLPGGPKQYKLTQLEIPLGFGFKYFVKENMYVGLEVLHRKLFTDYVDDVSKNYYVDPAIFNTPLLSPDEQAKALRLFYRGKYASGAPNSATNRYERGDPKQNDAFFSTILRFGWRLNGSNTPNGRALRQLKCPVFY